MSKQLNTVAPKKWVASFSGAAPTLDTTDGVSNGDIAIDISTTPNKVWRCLVNTDSAPVWHEIDMRNPTGIGTSTPLDLLHIKGSDETPDANDITHNNVYLEAPTGGDTGIWIGDEVSGPCWFLQNYRNEASNYLYLWNQVGMRDLLAVSSAGRVGISNPSDVLNYHSWYVNPATGALNDMDVGGQFTSRTSAQYEVAIAATGTPDTIKWRKSLNDGTTWTAYSTPTAITGAAQDIEKGITVTFGATTGHNLNDIWRFQASSQLPASSLAVHPAAYKEILHTADYTAGTPAFIDVTGEMAWTLAGSIDMPGTGTTSAVYVGDHQAFATVYMVLNSGATGATVKVEYYNTLTSAWTQITALANEFSDTTANLTVTGILKWDKDTMPNWGKANLPGKDADEYTLYWVRITSTTEITVAPSVLLISYHGGSRFSVYPAHLDTMPCFNIDALGRISIGTNTAVGNNQLQISYPYGSKSSITSTESFVEFGSNDSSHSELAVRLSQSTATESAEMSVCKSRGTLATPSNLVNGDNVGRMRYKGFVGGAWEILGGHRLNYSGDGTTKYGTLDFYLNSAANLGKILRLSRDTATGNGQLQMYNDAAAVGAAIEEFSIDGTLAGNSDLALPTEKAVKTYVDGWHKYGEMSQAGNTTATDILGAGTWAKVLNYATGLVSGFTYGTSDLTVDTTGVYQVSGTASLLVGNNADVCEIAIAVGGTPQTKTTQTMKPNTTAVRLSATASGLLSLTAGNVVTLVIRNTVANRDVTVTESNVSLHRIA